MSDSMMQAVRFHEYGGPDVLVLERAPRPQPQADQVLMRVLAAGVNPADASMRAGLYKEFMPVQLPWIPGYEGAGIIEAVGENVTAFQPGQAVFGFVTGGYAEYAVAAASDVQPKPAHLTFEQAASVPMGALVAWQAVIEVANVQAGQHILVHGAAGGIGLYAVQLARWKGASVIGTASASNVEFVRSLGVEQVIDYKVTPFETTVRNMDVVVDTAGGDVIERSWQVLRPDGILVTVAGRLGPDAGKTHGVRGVSTGRGSPDKLKQIRELLDAKQLTPAIRTLFTLAEAHQAQELAQTRHGRGRVVLLTA